MITCLIQQNNKIKIKNEITLSSETTCRECIYNTGIQCHGHGDYWAECSLYKKLRDQYKNCFNRKYDEYNIISDESKCIVYKKIIQINIEKGTKPDNALFNN